MYSITTGAAGADTSCAALPALLPFRFLDLDGGFSTFGLAAGFFLLRLLTASDIGMVPAKTNGTSGNTVLGEGAVDVGLGKDCWARLECLSLLTESAIDEAKLSQLRSLSWEPSGEKRGLPPESPALLLLATNLLSVESRLTSSMLVCLVNTCSRSR